MDEKPSPKPSKASKMGIALALGVALGVAVGTALGVALNNISLWELQLVQAWEQAWDQPLVRVLIGTAKPDADETSAAHNAGKMPAVHILPEVLTLQTPGLDVVI